MEMFKQEFVKEIEESMPDFIRYFEYMAKVAGVEGLFEPGYCSEWEQEPGQLLYEKDYYLLVSQKLGSYEWNNKGEEIICYYGRGWFTLSISCPLASGIQEMWVDQHIVGLINDYELNKKLF